MWSATECCSGLDHLLSCLCTCCLSNCCSAQEHCLFRYSLTPSLVLCSKRLGNAVRGKLLTICWSLLFVIPIACNACTHSELGWCRWMTSGNYCQVGLLSLAPNHLAPSRNVQGTQVVLEQQSFRSVWCLQATCGACSSSCSDTPPDSSYTCAQQAQFGKCSEP